MDLASLIRQLNGTRVSGIPAAASAHLLCHLNRERPAPTLVLLPSAEEAERFFYDAQLFTGLLGLPGPLHFPAWETLPHEFVSPLPEVAGRRMATLLAARGATAPFIVAPVSAVLHRLPPVEALVRSSIFLKAGAVCDPAGVPERLSAMGYLRTAQVSQPGQFAVRGDIVDIFPPHVDQPVRAEWFGDEVDRIGLFDADTQRTTEQIGEIVIAPVTELPADPERTRRAVAQVRAIGAERKLPESALILEAGRLDRTPRTDGIEAWAPFFFDAPLSAITDHMPPGVRVALVEEDRVQAVARGLLRKVAAALADEVAHGTILPDLAQSFTTLDGLLSGHTVLTFSSDPAPDAPALWRNVEEEGFGPIQAGDSDKEGRLGVFAERFSRLHGMSESCRVTLVCPDAGRTRAFADILKEREIPFHAESAPDGNIRLITGLLSRGFSVGHAGPDAALFLTEAEFFGRAPMPAPPNRSRLPASFTAFDDLTPGQYVVHLHHGVGIYRGLTSLTTGGVTADFLEIEYAGGDRVYVPADQLNLVQKFASGEEARPKLDRMGGKTWEKTKSRVRKELAELAQDLVELAAQREVARGHAFAPEGVLGEEFAASFPFTETPDQMRAIREVLADMERPRPMDRLVCGDVGYGKTEVAVRAAMKAMADHHQVLFLVPTTLLAQQHFATCMRRFAPYPFRIELLSRFRTQKEQKAVLAGLADGTVDMAIGTHRLLTQELDVQRLGLLIIDEEQRFGVAHKEKIKQMKTQVDVLTLTATPIPRTLQLSLIGVRDLSIIDTPPPDRRAVQTRVARFDPTLIAEAIERELARGGQVFFIHNRVQELGAITEFIRRQVPKANIAAAHGQMPERQLEKIMQRFIAGEHNVLVSTSIVESGLDIPRANTIIINRADRFGLSELYQLRGRVGRSGTQAYAYLLGPEDGWSGEAKERLMAIQAFTDLGSGFRIAARDLEIRGAGSLLGHRQSGHITQVGIDTYMRLIKEAMAEIRGETLPPEFETVIRLKIPVSIDEAYIPDSGSRLAIYQRLSGIERDAEADDLLVELTDRFGDPPAAIADLIYIARIRVLARQLRLAQLEYRGKGAYAFTFDPAHTLSEVGLRSLINSYGPRLRFSGEHAFTLDLGRAPEEGGLPLLIELLGAL